MFEFLKKLCNIGQCKEDVSYTQSAVYNTVVKCNASDCMDNENGECILSTISLDKDKLSSKNVFACSEYSQEDQEIAKAFKEEARIVQITKVG